MLLYKNKMLFFLTHATGGRFGFGQFLTPRVGAASFFCTSATGGMFGFGQFLTPRVRWNVFDQVCSFKLEVSNFFIAICMLQYFYCNIHIATCNMHIAMQYRFFSSK
jgi:hypothetical protein